jgi:mannose-6-phosphate isomerase-like protein (cupin superfamily)
MDFKTLTASAVAKHQVDETWGSLKWLASQEIGNADGLTLGHVIIKPGKSNPRHCHPNCEEVLYLMSGQLEHVVGEKKIPASAGDVFTVSAGVYHHATNTGSEDAHMIVAYSEGNREMQFSE